MLYLQDDIEQNKTDDNIILMTIMQNNSSRNAGKVSFGHFFPDLLGNNPFGIDTANMFCMEIDGDFVQEETKIMKGFEGMLLCSGYSKRAHDMKDKELQKLIGSNKTEEMPIYNCRYHALEDNPDYSSSITGRVTSNKIQDFKTHEMIDFIMIPRFMCYKVHDSDKVKIVKLYGFAGENISYYKLSSELQKIYLECKKYLLPVTNITIYGDLHHQQQHELRALRFLDTYALVDYMPIEATMSYNDTIGLFCPYAEDKFVYIPDCLIFNNSIFTETMNISDLGIMQQKLYNIENVVNSNCLILNYDAVRQALICNILAYNDNSILNATNIIQMHVIACEQIADNNGERQYLSVQNKSLTIGDIMDGRYIQENLPMLLVDLNQCRASEYGLIFYTEVDRLSNKSTTIYYALKKLLCDEHYLGLDNLNCSTFIQMVERIYSCDIVENTTEQQRNVTLETQHKDRNDMIMLYGILAGILSFPIILGGLYTYRHKLFQRFKNNIRVNYGLTIKYKNLREENEEEETLFMVSSAHI